MIKIFITLILFSTLSCTNEKPKTAAQEDRHEDFLKELTLLSGLVLENHGACKEWSTNIAPSWYQLSSTGSQAQQAGRYHQLKIYNKSGLDQLFEQFDVKNLSRHIEYSLYNLPLRYPTSDRNIEAFLQTTHPLPECDTTFTEYAILDALLDSRQFGSWDQEVKNTIAQFLNDYLDWTLTQERINYGNILTNASLMRSMAEYQLFPPELVPALDVLLNEAETYHRQSMESFRRVAISEIKPTISEYRSILVLHREREEKAQNLARVLRGHLERSKRAQLIMDR
jgi:hypothetical protein